MPHPAWLYLFDTFTVNIQIQTFPLNIAFDTQAAADFLNRLQNGEAHHAAVNHGGQSFFQLNQQLHADRCITTENLVVEENTGQHRSNQTAETVDTECIQRIVVTEAGFNHDY